MSANPFADPKPSYALDADPFKEPAHANASQWSINDTVEVDELPTPRPDQQRENETATRLQELRQREQDLEARERTLDRREEMVKNYGKNNWPPYFPLIFHNIEAEIPSESRTVVLTLYRVWMLLGLTLILNLVACILLLVSGRPDGASDMGAAIMYVPVIGITSFILWYRPIYNAKENAVFFYLFFIFGGFHLAFSAYMLVGIPSTGSAGLINLIGCFATGSIVAGVFCAVATAGWTMQMLGLLWEYRAIWAHFNNKGHTFEEAKGELQRAGFKAYFTRGSKV